VEVNCGNGLGVRIANGWAENPGYRRDLPTDRLSLNHAVDIGIFELNSRIPESLIKPLPLARSSAEIQTLAKDSSKCVMAGFGGAKLNSQAHRYEVSFSTEVTTTAWQRLIPTSADLVPIQTYFAFTGPDQFLIPGDSGGPLLCPDASGAWHVVGIHTWTQTWGDPLNPKGTSGMTWISNYLDWLGRSASQMRRLRHRAVPVVQSTEPGATDAR
jgi:hypothetical protein